MDPSIIWRLKPVEKIQQKNKFTWKNSSSFSIGMWICCLFFNSISFELVYLSIQLQGYEECFSVFEDEYLCDDVDVDGNEGGC